VAPLRYQLRRKACAASSPPSSPGAKALAAARHLPGLRRAIRLQERVVIRCVDGSDGSTDRMLRALIPEFWSRVWTLDGSCETRTDVRSFRVDRIESLRQTVEAFPVQSGRALADRQRRIAVRSLALRLSRLADR
jgi:predicted DNA-binding transcriptional regulator YafY